MVLRIDHLVFCFELVLFELFTLKKWGINGKLKIQIGTGSKLEENEMNIIECQKLFQILRRISTFMLW